MDHQKKWEYIDLISRYSDRYGNQLLALMEKFQVESLREITEEQAKEFWQRIKEKEQGTERND